MESDSDWEIFRDAPLHKCTLGGVSTKSRVASLDLPGSCCDKKRRGALQILFKIVYVSFAHTESLCFETQIKIEQYIVACL